MLETLETIKQTITTKKTKARNHPETLLVKSLSRAKATTTTTNQIKELPVFHVLTPTLAKKLNNCKLYTKRNLAERFRADLRNY